MPLLNPVTSETVAAALQQCVGMKVAPEAIDLQYRDWRWVAILPECIVFVADSPAHAARLGRESRLLQLLRPRVHFYLPRIHALDTGFGLAVRGMVSGAQLGGEGRERRFADRPQGARLADELGRALAELHAALSVAELSALGFSTSEAILPRPDVLATRLEGRIPDPKIMKTFDALIESYRGVEADPADIVLVHGDVWGGNLAVDLETGALNGVFDFADAGIADRHLDLMYIHSFGAVFTERLFASYAERSGRTVSPQRTALYHAIAAFAALAETANNAEDHLLEQRRRWVTAVCDGPVARMALTH
jgi:aminoglycoside phosphotransferase (APT) family kinase protein